jgi:hypothetical protein
MTHDYKVVKRQVERRRADAGFSKEEEALERRKDLNDLSTFPIEHARLRSEPYFFFVLIASTITYGWVLDKGVHLSVPLIMQFFSKPFSPSGQALHEGPKVSMSEDSRSSALCDSRRFRHDHLQLHFDSARRPVSRSIRFRHRRRKEMSFHAQSFGPY